MTIKEKILKVLENKGITEYRFYKETGVSRGTLSNKSGINEETIVKFFAYFPDIDANSIFRNVLSTLEYSIDSEENILREMPEDYLSRIDELINSKNEIIEVLKREVEDLRSDKNIFKRIIDIKLIEVH